MALQQRVGSAAHTVDPRARRSGGPGESARPPADVPLPRPAPLLRITPHRQRCRRQVVQARLRRASAKTTLDTYGHLWPDTDDSTRAAIDSVMAAREGNSRATGTSES